MAANRGAFEGLGRAMNLRGNRGESRAKPKTLERPDNFVIAE
jgi:hypothetical protein